MLLTHAILPSRVLTFENSGPDLIATNFWDTPLAAAGFCFLSWRQGVARLLVPQAHVAAVREMSTGREVLMTSGTYRGRTDCLELLWEDHSVAPFSITMSPEQLDRRGMPRAVDRATTCAVYLRGFRGKPSFVGEWPVRFRRAATLPCLQSWKS